MYFHAMPLKRVCFGTVQPNPRFSDAIFRPAYYWLEQELGYYPFFLAVAQDTDTIYSMTGFNANFKTRQTVYSHKVGKLVNSRESNKKPHQVLFRFHRDAFTQLHHQDFHAWNMILNTHDALGHPDPSKVAQAERRLRLWKRILLKQDWTDAQWYQKSARDTHSVQATTPELDLRKAKAVYCKTRKAQKYLQALGFQNVILYRAKRYERPRPFRESS